MNAIDLALWGSAGVLAAATLWWARPSPVALDWERFFKLTLLTQLRGQVESGQGTANEWAEKGREKVWFSNLARMPFVKLLKPSPRTLKVPALPGELALTQALIDQPNAQARLTLMYGVGQDAELYEEPESAGEAWRLPQYLGRGADWDSLASLGDPIVEAIRRKGQQVWIQLGGLDLPLQELLPRTSSLSTSTPQDTANAIDALGPNAEDRFVLLAAGADASLLLDTLKAFDGLRDRVLAVVLIDPELSERQEWLNAHFNHQDFDTELARPTGWFQLRFLERNATERQVAHRALALPVPSEAESGRVSIELVELGLLPGSHQEAEGEWLARGLVLTVLAWLGSRG
ncbi:MAG: hypothetical protein ACI9VR_003910 [Cognaticolwellia sp.]